MNVRRLSSHLLTPTRSYFARTPISARTRNMASAPEGKVVPIDLEITSDSICPFCYLGYKKINLAIEKAKSQNLPVSFTMRFHPFQLDPTLPTDRPISKRERYSQKFGAQRFEVMERSMIERGKEVGIEFSYGGPVRQTFDSHRLIEKAWEKGGEGVQRKVLEGLFEGYFERERDVGDREWLGDVGVQAGVFGGKDEAKTFFEGEEFVRDVKEGIRKANLKGIHGVPHTIVNGKTQISGAQDPETFYQVFKAVSEGKDVAFADDY